MEPKDIQAADGGWKSRKFWLSVFTQLLIILSAKLLPLTALETAVMGLVSVAAIFVGGNVGSRWMISRSVKPTKAKEVK